MHTIRAGIGIAMTTPMHLLDAVVPPLSFTLAPILTSINHSGLEFAYFLTIAAPESTQIVQRDHSQGTLGRRLFRHFGGAHFDGHTSTIDTVTPHCTEIFFGFRE